MKPWCNGYRHWRYSFVFNVNFGQISNIALVRSSPPEVLLGKGVLKIYRKFTGEHLCRKICSWFGRQLTFVSTYFKICFRNKRQLSLWKPSHFCVKWLVQKQPPRGVPRKRCSENMQQIYRRTPMPKCDFNKVAKQLYWNRTLAWVFSCKFAAYSQNTFS